MEKIRDSILSADCVIADVSGSNPNVFYEVGLAHAFGKPVIFLTQDDPASAPVDIRQFEFIPYHLAHHKEFLSNLDNAIQHVFVTKY
jgi:nucleoside 2-deoxyribosyltransferase